MYALRALTTHYSMRDHPISASTLVEDSGSPCALQVRIRAFVISWFLDPHVLLALAVLCHLAPCAISRGGVLRFAAAGPWTQRRAAKTRFKGHAGLRTCAHFRSFHDGTQRSHAPQPSESSVPGNSVWSRVRNVGSAFLFPFCPILTVCGIPACSFK